MADTLHRLGVILLRVERDLSSPPSPEALTEYIDAVLRTHYAAKASMAAGLDEALASAVSSDGERLIDMFTRLLDAVGVGQIPELSTKISVILPAVIRGERVEESSLLVEAVEQRAEAKAARLVEAELARLRGDGLLAIAASAAAGVHGPSGGAPDSSPGGLSQTRSAGLVGAAVGAGGLPADAAASAGEIVDAELVDEPAARELGGRDPRRCPACAQDRFASDHNQHCGWNEVAGRMSLYSPLLGR